MCVSCGVLGNMRMSGVGLTFFLNCLWMASSASLMVTPLRFRAVTSRPRGKWRSIFLMGGVTSSFLRTAGSSTVEGEAFSFLELVVSRGLHQW